MRLFFLILMLIVMNGVYAQNGEYIVTQVKAGEGAYSLLERFGLEKSSENIQRFKEINQLDDLSLRKDKDYKIPILEYKYDAKSIRSTINKNDWDYAVKIQEFNERVHQLGLKANDYRADNILWVPDILPATPIKEGIKSTSADIKGVYSIFGKEYEEVKLKSHQLKGHVYYVVSGHGGPDPGAVVTFNGHQLCEDEYAYDISLRLARNLLEHDATVYMITRDNNDGIRSDSYLKADKDEVCYPEQVIPLNQVKRLNQRVYAINALYKEHKKEGAIKQRAIIIHVDSRSRGERIDMFFYHNPRSNTGKKLANTLQNTIAAKYNMHQKNRGYSGTVKARNLHMLRETYPVAVYAELGNIRNDRDQKRFIIEDNRQAVANWLCEGIINDN
ncbi:MAG: N-acetylmuramoyl-L-alanine amidase [Bacteroidales bacterium]|nr:N-acetylmuramoyl-L-alanine amidase [Bacteroidales bacterium]MCF8405111.1 N-acetylmuramoyl-L-alanine amidase [Bacteroidales bacterium]